MNTNSGGGAEEGLGWADAQENWTVGGASFNCNEAQAAITAVHLNERQAERVPEDLLVLPLLRK